MAIAQRGVGPTSLTGSNLFAADRFSTLEDCTTGAGTFQVNILTSSDLPYLFGCQFSHKVVATTGFSPINAQRVEWVRYVMEGYDFATVAKKTCNLSFFIKSNKTGIGSIAFKNSAVTRSLVMEYTINSANTWQEVSMIINFKTGTSSGTWLYDNSAGLLMQFRTALGASTNLGTNGVWATANNSGTTASQANNLLSTTNDYIEITGLRLTEGAEKQPYRKASGTYAGELALCQRYAFVINSIGTLHGLGTAYCGSTTTIVCPIPFPVPPRAYPTVAVSNATHFTVYQANGNTVATAVSNSGFNSNNMLNLSATVASGLTIGQVAMLYMNSASGQIVANMEL